MGCAPIGVKRRGGATSECADTFTAGSPIWVMDAAHYNHASGAARKENNARLECPGSALALGCGPGGLYRGVARRVGALGIWASAHLLGLLSRVALDVGVIEAGRTARARGR